MKKTDYKTINIMTSCDANLINLVAIQLQSIAENLSDKNINFFLLHREIPNNRIHILEKLCASYKNVSFKEIQVPNPELYDKLAEGGGGWCGEAYYSFCAHQLLPKYLDRVLYIDAGDILIVDDIDDYYFSDFEDKSLIVTASRFKICNNQLFFMQSEDLHDRENLKGIVRGIFNSGSYVINLEKLRKEPYTLEDYLALSDMLKNIIGSNTNAYWGDQGLLSAAFVGDMKPYRYPEITNLWYMPYNFCVWFFDRMIQKPDYHPSIIHYAGGAFKPWKGDYPIFLERFQDKSNLHSLNELKLGQAEYYYLWHEYALKTEQALQKINI